MVKTERNRNDESSNNDTIMETGIETDRLCGNWKYDEDDEYNVGDTVTIMTTPWAVSARRERCENGSWSAPSTAVHATPLVILVAGPACQGDRRSSGLRAQIRGFSLSVSLLLTHAHNDRTKAGERIRAGPAGCAGSSLSRSGYVALERQRARTESAREPVPNRYNSFARA